MNRKVLKTIFAAVLCLGVMATPALAQMSISIDIGRAPPPPRHEQVRVVPMGHVWLPGYWAWDGGRHQWMEGRMERARPGHHWRQASWEDRGQVHHFEPGRWEPDHKQYRGKPKIEKHGKGNARGNDRRNGGDPRGDHGRRN
jgi:hypothetical protein